jgi:membrane dipeptidase
VNALELHRDALVCNLHDDWSIEVQRAFLRGEQGAIDRIYGDKLAAGGIDFTFYTVGGDDVMFTQDTDLFRGTLRAVDGAHQEVEASENFVLCTSVADIDAAKAAGKFGLMLTIEGAAPIEESLGFLRNLYRLGLRSLILTWFKANPTADGIGEERNGGLTTFGRLAVQEMNRLGILIDISQATPSTVSDVLALSEHPVIASHSNCSGCYLHRRNLTDEQLTGIAAGGGLVGITAYPAHVADGETDIEAFLDQIDYARSVVGVDHVGLGLNMVVHDPDEAKSFYERSGIEYSSFHLPGLEDLERTPAVTEGLARRGYSESDIRQILGGNLRRVIGDVVG